MGSAVVLTSQLTASTPFSHLLSLSLVLLFAASLFYLVLRRTLRARSGENNEPPVEHEPPDELKRLKASYTASLSHELRTPLNAIIGFTGIILQGMSGEITERQRDQLERILSSAKRLLSMITDLIEVAKIDAGSAEYHPSSFHLGTAIEEVAREISLNNHPNFKDVSLDIEISPHLRMHADRKKFQQCIINLLACVVEYTHTKNITIAAEENGDDLSIIIGSPHENRQQRSLKGLFRALKTGEIKSGKRAECNNLRLHLITRMITELFGGSISLDARSKEMSVLRVSFKAVTDEIAGMG